MAGNYIKVRVVGEEELRKALKGKKLAFITAMKEAIPLEAEDLGKRANQLAPVGVHEENVVGDGKVVREKQHLRDTLRVTIDLRKPTRVFANIAYTAKHAAAVHEGLHWGKHFQTRGMKWFEKALQAFGAGFMDRINARLRKLVGGG